MESKLLADTESEVLVIARLDATKNSILEAEIRIFEGIMNDLTKSISNY
jgi:hypothetical protein